MFKYTYYVIKNGDNANKEDRWCVVCTMEAHSEIVVFEQIFEEKCVRQLQGYQMERCLKQKEQQLQRQGVLGMLEEE